MVVTQVAAAPVLAPGSQLPQLEWLSSITSIAGRNLADNDTAVGALVKGCDDAAAAAELHVAPLLLALLSGHGTGEGKGRE